APRQPGLTRGRRAGRGQFSAIATIARVHRPRPARCAELNRSCRISRASRTVTPGYSDTITATVASMLECVAEEYASVAAMPGAPEGNGRPGAGMAMPGGAGGLTGTADTASRGGVCPDPTGHRPAAGPASARAANSNPNATPATRPSTRAVLSMPRAAVPL